MEEQSTGLIDLQPQARLAPYFKMAYEIANQSPCIRRKYGAVVVYVGTEVKHVATCNARMNSRCCEGRICIRDRVSVANGERTEVGAEIHAETAALITSGPNDSPRYFVLVGLNKNGKPLYGKDAYPCHACALALKYAGYRHVWMEDGPGSIRAYSVSRILEERMEEWQREI